MHLCEDSPALLRQFEGQNIANLLWGYCTTGFNPSASFLRALAKVRHWMGAKRARTAAVQLAVGQGGV